MNSSALAKQRQTYLRIVLFIMGILTVFICFSLDSELMTSLGFMVHSLSSENDLTRTTALIELKVLRVMIGLSGAAFFVGALFWERLLGSNLYNRFTRNGDTYPCIYRSNISTFIDYPSAFVFLLCGVSVFYLAFGVGVLSESALKIIAREEGIVEILSALVLLCSSILAARIGFEAKCATSTRVFHSLLAVLFFLMFGEELSWGQHLLKFDTPQLVASVNVQGEANMHNMFGYFFDHLFILCFFLWGCVLPLLYRYSRFSAAIFSSVGLVLPNIGLSGAMLLITLLQASIVAQFIVLDDSMIRVAELREFLSAACFFALMCQSWSSFVGRIAK